MSAREVTTELACAGLWGPKARVILQSVCAEDVSNAAFPYMTWQEITIAGVRASLQKGIRAFVTVHDQALSQMLGDSENPAHTALARGTDVDKPRNLAKSVTVE